MRKVPIIQMSGGYRVSMIDQPLSRRTKWLMIRQRVEITALVIIVGLLYGWVIANSF